MIKRLRFPAVLAFAFLLSGCVYLRLLELKNQLADFERNVAVQESDSGLRLVFKRPSVQGQDLIHLGVRPARRTQTAEGEVWDVVMRKRYPSLEKESRNFDVQLQAEFEQEMLTAVFVPRRYLDAFPPEFIIETVKALGESKVFKLKRSIAATYDSSEGAVPPVSIAKLRDTLGEPYEETVDEERITIVYRYSKKTPEWEADKQSPQKIYHITFVFDRDDGELLSAGTRSIYVQYAETS